MGLTSTQLNYIAPFIQSAEQSKITTAQTEEKKAKTDNNKQNFGRLTAMNK